MGEGRLLATTESYERSSAHDSLLLAEKRILHSGNIMDHKPVSRHPYLLETTQCSTLFPSTLDN